MTKQTALISALAVISAAALAGWVGTPRAVPPDSQSAIAAAQARCSPTPVVQGYPTGQEAAQPDCATQETAVYLGPVDPNKPSPLHQRLPGRRRSVPRVTGRAPGRSMAVTVESAN
jgi:hypothetical protein